MRKKTPDSNAGLPRAGREIELLHALNAAAASLQRSAHSEAEVFRAFHEQIAELGLRGVIGMLDEESERLVIRVVAHPGQTLARLEELIGLKAEGFEFSLARVDTYRQVVETGNAVFIPDTMGVIAQLLPEGARPFAGQIIQAFGTSCSIFSPLIVEGRVWGVLAVTDAGLLPGDVPAIEAFANHISVALDNARLFAAMQQAEAQYRRLFETANDGILVIDPASARVLSANRKAVEMIGRSEAELLAMPVTALQSGKVAEEALQLLEAIRDQGQAVFELRLSWPDGPDLVAQVSATMFEADGRWLMQSVMRDITERKRAEEALAYERDLLHTLMDNVPDGIYFKDAASCFTRINRAQAQVLGVNDPAEAIGKTDFDFFRAELARDFHADEQEIVKSGKPLIDKVEGVEEANGRFRWVSATKVPVLDRKGRVTGIVGISRDITERKQAEEALARSEAFNRRLVEASPVGILYLDAAGIITYENPAMRRMMGVPGEMQSPVIGVKIAEVPPIKEAGMLPLFERCLAGETIAGEVAHYRSLMGSQVDLEIHAAPLMDAWGKWDGAIVIAQDITGRKQVEDEKARLFEALSQQREQLRALAGRLAEVQEAERKQLAQELHDLVGRNLTALDLNLNMIRAQISSASPAVASIQDCLEESLVLVEQTAECIRDVMANLRPPVLDDYGLVAALRWYGTQVASWAGLTVSVQGEEPVPRLVTSVETALFRIAQEALTNVAKHAQASEVTVLVAVEDGTTCLTVTDNGLGFEFALPAELSGRHGWGLLSMTERAEAIGGECHIESRPGLGTQVMVQVGR
jgi:two-component system sensor histidine kinase UhpB